MNKFLVTNKVITKEYLENETDVLWISVSIYSILNDMGGLKSFQVKTDTVLHNKNEGKQKYVDLAKELKSNGTWKWQ